MSLPEFSNTNTTNTEPDFVPSDGLNQNTFQLIGTAWSNSNKQQKVALSSILVLVFGLPLFIGLGVMNQQLLRQKAAEPIITPTPVISSTPDVSPTATASASPTISPLSY